MGSNNDGDANKVKMFFFPYIAGGHLLPMIDIARYFTSSHSSVQATIITTPKTALLFQSAINRDREAGHDISIHTLEIPNKSELGETENFLNTLFVEQKIKVLTAFQDLKDPLQELLLECRPHCFVSDLMHSWTLDIAHETGVPWVAFHSTSLFVLCAEDCLTRLKPQHTVDSNTEPFILTGLTNEDNQVEYTRSRLPEWHRSDAVPDEFKPINRFRIRCEKSFATIVNSCTVLESSYCSLGQKAVGASRLSVVGPVSVYSTRNIDDVQVRNQVEKDGLLSWLDSNEPSSVVYVSLGSEANLCKEQFHEIAHGLEASGRPFIWVFRPNLYKDQGEEGWFPEGFEARIRGSNRGLLIKGWAPQLEILGHASVGVFVTHCGWNSCLEGLTNGVPMIAWPLTNDQFYIECLMVDVLKVGIRAGNEEWMSTNTQPKVMVTREKVEVAVKRIMGGGEEVEEMRRNVKSYAEKCKLAVQEGGSSHQNVCALVEELKSSREG